MAALSPESPEIDALRGLYRRGMFLMADERTGRIRAYRADPRAVIPLTPEQGLTVPRSLRQRVRSGKFRVTTDAAFRRVMHACSMRRREGTWISTPLIDLYVALHEAGPGTGEHAGVHAHSIEAWLDTDAGPTLVGGLYGVAVGAIFCGESMFSRPDLGGTDASKVALVHLIHHLNARGFKVLDSQLWNPHLAQFGCTEIRARRFEALMLEHRDDARPWLPFEPAPAGRGDALAQPEASGALLPDPGDSALSPGLGG